MAERSQRYEPRRKARPRSGRVHHGRAGRGGQPRHRRLHHASVGSLAATASPTQIRALLVLRDTGGCSNTELAGQLKIFPSSASRITDRLTATGWITRQTASQDRREIRLILTPAGHRTVDQFVQNRRDIIGAVLTGMRRSEQMALLRGLTAYADAAHRLNTTAESR